MQKTTAKETDTDELIWLLLIRNKNNTGHTGLQYLWLGNGNRLSCWKNFTESGRHKIVLSLVFKN